MPFGMSGMGYGNQLHNMFPATNKPPWMLPQARGMMGVPGWQPKMPGIGQMLSPDAMLRAKVAMQNAMLNNQTQLALGGMRQRNQDRSLYMNALAQQGGLGMGMANLGAGLLGNVVAPWHMQQARMPTKGQQAQALQYF